jgi:putative ABC transport system permease protein
VFRSLKHNKASVVGLTFLVFLSIGIFTILNSVSSNISNEYSRITTSGNLHDFTISENYVIGNAKYDFDNNPFDPTDPTKNEYMGESSDGKSVP